jgi:hypothetical protein
MIEGCFCPSWLDNFICLQSRDLFCAITIIARSAARQARLVSLHSFEAKAKLNCRTANGPSPEVRRAMEPFDEG